MAMGPSYGKALARKAPPPDAMEALGDSPDDSEPDGGDDDVEAQSAYEDFARLAGFKADPKTFAAFKELVNLIMLPEHRRLHPDAFK